MKKVVSIICFLIIFCCLVNANAYFLETPDRENTYDLITGGVVMDIIENGDYLYAIQTNSITSGVVIKINKETNAILQTVMIWNNDCNSIRYDCIKVFDDKLYISGTLTQTDPNEVNIYRPFLWELSLNLINKNRHISPFTSCKEIYTTLSSSGNYYIAYNDDKIHTHRLNINNGLVSMWEKEIYNLSPRLKDIKADGDYVYIAHTLQESDILWSKIIKYNKYGSLITLGVTQAYHSNGILARLKIDSGSNRVIVAESKSTLTNNESDEICVKTYDTEDLMFYKQAIIPINGILHTTTISALEEDIYLGIGLYKLQDQYPWTPYASQVKVIAIEGVDMSVKRIINEPNRSPDEGIKNLTSCVYTRDEVYLESKNGIPICQKRLSLIESFGFVHDKLEFHDFWIPKSTLVFFDATGINLSALPVEIYGITPYIDWLYTKVIYMDVLGQLKNGNETTIISPFMGYWVIQGYCMRHHNCEDVYNYDYSHIAISGKEILWYMYTDYNYDKLVGFGTYPGFVYKTISGDPVFMYPGSFALQYCSIPVIGGLTIPGFGYKISPQGEPYIFEVDQTEE